MKSFSLYVGLMSGTSLDGVDGVLTGFDGRFYAAYVPFPDSLRDALLALQESGHDEIHRESIAANTLTALYADCVQRLLAQAGISAAEVRAIGAHGQTIRHNPAQGYTRQIQQPALLAELTGIDVVADFRSRDIAAGGQGAPLVPAFHQAMFGSTSATRVVANIGGISNISVLHPDGRVRGYDTGPGNVLMDLWAARHLGLPYDRNGDWAASGTVDQTLLDHLMAEPYLALPSPKSTGRDLFNATWLERQLAAFAGRPPEDIQATLNAFTARSLAEAIRRDAGETEAVYVCGGGAMNGCLMTQLATALTVPVLITDVLGISPQHVEAVAFAWLAARFCDRLPGNLPAVTGARGPRILGALYPAWARSASACT